MLISAFLRGRLAFDFMIFAGVWFFCFSTSTDVGFCLTRFSIGMFALLENVCFMVVSC